MNPSPPRIAPASVRPAAALALLAALLLALAGIVAESPVLAQDGTDDASERADQAAIRVVHGAPDAGAVDLYVDGAVALFGITFPSVSDVLFLPTGDRELRIVPTGAAPDQALAATTLALVPGQLYDVAALGPLADLQVNVYEVDRAPLAAGRARLRLVHGVPDAGALALAVPGEDGAVLPAAQFPNETDYLDLEAGGYDFELRAEDGTPLLDLAGTELGSGRVYDLFAVGLVADGSLQALTIPSQPPAATAPTGRPAALIAGGCAAEDRGEIVSPLNGPALPPGDPLGQTGAALGENSVTSVALTLDDVLAADHAIAVLASAEEDAAPVACGEIGGTLTENGALVVGLRQVDGSGIAGVAILAPSALDPATIDVSVLVAADLVAADPDDAPEADPTATVAPAPTPDPDEAEAEGILEPDPTLEQVATVEPNAAEEDDAPTATAESNAADADDDIPVIQIPTETP